MQPLQRIPKPYRCGHCQTPGTRYRLARKLKGHFIREHPEHAHHRKLRTYRDAFLDNEVVLCEQCELKRILATYNHESLEIHAQMEHNVRRGSRVYRGMRWVGSYVSGVYRRVSELFEPPDQEEEDP